MSDKIQFNAIAAMCNENRGIGKNNELPWSLPNEFNYFLNVVKKSKNKSKINAVIVGRLTWESIPIQFRPIKPCLHIIITSKMCISDIVCNDPADCDKVLICKSIDEAINIVNDKYSDLVENIYSIGGSDIYRKSIESNQFRRFYLTRIFEKFDCDTFIEPENFLDNFKKVEVKDLCEEQNIYECEYNKEIVEPSNGVKYVFEVYDKVK